MNTGEEGDGRSNVKEIWTIDIYFGLERFYFYRLERTPINKSLKFKKKKSGNRNTSLDCRLSVVYLP